MRDNSQYICKPAMHVVPSDEQEERYRLLYANSVAESLNDDEDAIIEWLPFGPEVLIFPLHNFTAPEDSVKNSIRVVVGSPTNASPKVLYDRSIEEAALRLLANEQ